MPSENNIPAMTPPVVHDYLYNIGRQWTGRGVAVELGSWFGASTAALLKGLKEAGYRLPLYCYDKWQANDEEAGKARTQGVDIREGQDILPIFIENVQYDNVVPVKGSILRTIASYPGDPIEVCLFDAPKRDPLFSHCIRVLSKHWITGVTVVGLLDYYFYRRHNQRKVFLAPVRFIEDNAGCFERLAEWPDECSCVFFRYIKPLKRI